MAEDKNKKKPKIEDEIDEVEKAQKEMEDLLKSLQDEVGGNKVNVMKVELPQPTLKNYFIGLVIAIILNTLIIVGSSGFFTVYEYEKIIKLIIFAVYFSIMERTINYIFVKLFLPLIIRTMGIAALIPYAISIVVVTLFPVFVTIKNLFIGFIFLVVVCIIRTVIHSFIKNKLLSRNIRRRK